MKKSLKRIFDITVYSGFIISIASHIIINNSNILDNNKIILKNMSESIQESDLNKTIEELNSSHTKYANYIQTSKINLATAITNAGIETDSNANFETMITNVSNIITNKTGDATATESQILKEQTAYVNGEKVTGTMPNNGAWTNTPTEKGKVTIPEGYHNGNGYVDTTSVYNAGVTDEKNESSVIYLGEGRSFDVSFHPNYNNFTVDNFIVTGQTMSNFSSSASYSSPGWCTQGNYISVGASTTVSTTLSKSYNATTGILTAYLNTTGSTTASADLDKSSSSKSNSATSNVKVYLVTGTITQRN